jgi:hypothetical protein
MRAKSKTMVSVYPIEINTIYFTKYQKNTTIVIISIGAIFRTE